MSNFVITKLRDPLKNYPDHDNKEFLSLDEYHTIARKVIARFGKKLTREMLNSEDAVTDVAHAIMKADWTWDETKSRTRRSYRNSMAIYAIQEYATYKRLKKNKVRSSLSDPAGGDTTLSLVDVVPNPNQQEPVDILIGEKSPPLGERIKIWLRVADLTNQQRRCIEKHFLDSMTLHDIARMESISLQAVHAQIKKGLLELRFIAGG